ncbi:hypothetical protein JM84_1230 [Dokdonia sp. Hel_I_63]|jgi:hypothetical protein|uniref:hypothetical protein n=1 Tax=unclassified Dokdonia TaxID=2615033 RepID=UPI00020A67F8|nr:MULTISPECIES: hypothetical protein [unclassified Dokdonia]AEE18432.1 hypothetical protein Krodi_0446 [Dokdonia sp. 4H-3-7-5]TVZ22337.1 hypothetical protein JM84_1230 [Dokdonia sp. Hel_I_63]
MTNHQSTQKLDKKINILTTYAVVSALVFSAFALSSFSKKDNNKSYDELIVKKLTVIGEDNLPRMVLSNEDRQHSGRMNGKEMDRRERPSGIIFFNNEGDECGGLVYKTKIKNGKVTSGMSFTMDNYKDDQVVQILNDEYYKDGKAYIKRGISINQYPIGSNMEKRNNKLMKLRSIEDDEERKQKINELMENEGPVNRLFIGKTKGNSSGLFLAGPDGAPKMMIYVDDKGNPKIQTFNKNGEIKDLLEVE